MDSNNHPDFILSRTFHAPRADVYAAWAQPDRMATWSNFGDAVRTFKRFELRPGGVQHTVSRAPDGSETWDFVSYEEVVPNERLVYVQSFSDAEGNPTRHPMSATWPLRMRTTLTFEDAGENQTRLGIRWQTVDATEAEQKTFDESHDGMRQGWNMMLDTLDSFLTNSKS